MAPAARPIRIGIAGFGTAGRSFVPAIRAHGGFELAGVADTSSDIRDEVGRELQVGAHGSLAEMLESKAALDVVYVATPTDLHAEHVALVARAKKHVLVEKPMAVNVEVASKIVAAVEGAGVVCVVGHSHGFDLPVQAMRDVIAGGTLEPVRMVHTWCYTDWMWRPRRPDELDAKLGGGVTYRQGAHQFDIIRLLCGGMARSVRARTFDWRSDRPGIGAHAVFIDFVDGAVATAMYNGYGGFSSEELCFDITELGFSRPSESRRPARLAAARSPEEELRAKRERSKNATWSPAPHQPFFGLTIVSCERGDIRQSPQGLYIYSDEGQTEITLPTNRGPRDLVLAELYDAIVGKTPAVHDARWGLANLEICDAAMASSASGSEVLLRHQVPVRTGRKSTP